MASRKQQRAIQLRTERRDNGFCIDCGLLASSGYSTCTNCRVLDTERRAEIVAKRRASGVCVCKRPLLDSGYVCEICWYKNKAQKATGLGRGGGEILKQLLESQSYRCAYTGEELVVGGQMATIDHKLPVARGGTDAIGNLHWITKRMNEMKGTFTHEEFLAVCAKVTKIWQKKQNQSRIG